MHHTNMYNYPRLPALINYEAAKQHYEAVKPIRGRYPEERPLGAVRRYTHMLIRQEVTSVEKPNDPLGEFATIYSCQLYSGRHNRVDFRPDGTIRIKTSSWRGPTTLMFFTYLLKAVGDMRSASGKWYFVNHSGEAFLLESELVLHFIDGHGYRPVDIKPEYKYKAKRKELNRIKKTYKPFIEYTKNMLLMDSKVTDATKPNTLKELGMESHKLRPSYNWGYEQATKNRNAFFSYVKQAQENNDLELMYVLANYATTSFGWYSYNHQSNICSPQAFEDGFTDTLKFHYAQEVFEEVEQPLGQGFYDRNAKYFKSN